MKRMNRPGQEQNGIVLVDEVAFVPYFGERMTVQVPPYAIRSNLNPPKTSP